MLFLAVALHPTMRITTLGSILAACATLTYGHPTEQVVLASPDPVPDFTAEDLALDVTSRWPLSTQVDDDTTGEGHLSQWSRQIKVRRSSKALPPFRADSPTS